MSTMYKIYTRVLISRLEEECEEKKVIPQNQTGFRKGMATMDNIYVINYLINKQLGKGKKVTAMFVDLKAAFDTMDRECLSEAMRGRGIRKRLICRMKKVLREPKSRVMAGGRESFWTARRVRQGCPLSPILFNLLIADLEEESKWRE